VVDIGVVTSSLVSHGGVLGRLYYGSSCCAHSPANLTRSFADAPLVQARLCAYFRLGDAAISEFGEHAKSRRGDENLGTPKSKAKKAELLWRAHEEFEERKKEAQLLFTLAGKKAPALPTAAVFCKLLPCAARDISIVEEFLR
jgi:hypothetical protein